MHTSTKIIRALYSLLFLIALPGVVLRVLIRSRKQPAYRRRLKERFGFIKPTHKPSIWIHSVSVGETIAAIPLIEALILNYPEQTIYVTTTTPTGSKQVLDHFGQTIRHSYLPYDVPCLLKRFIKRINPLISIMMETEVWPNLLFICHKKHIPTLLANARLSEKSFLGYLRLKNAAQDLFNLFSCIAAQSKLDADHFKQLGVQSTKIIITGSVKFDRDIATDITLQARALRQTWQLTKRPVIIAASTREGEEAYILQAYKHVKKLHPDCFLLLVPRHIERCNQIEKQCRAAGFTLQRRSSQSDTMVDCDILLGDTIGEMLLLYALSDIAFVGGSLVNTGCHNVLEPAALGMPIITGPYIRNFKVICNMLQQAKAQTIVKNADELAEKINALIVNPIHAQQMGKRALDVYQSNKGALAKHLNLIGKIMLNSLREFMK